MFYHNVGGAPNLPLDSYQVVLEHSWLRFSISNPVTLLIKHVAWHQERLCAVQLVACDSPAGKLGVTVCYDLRFPEMYQLLAWHLNAQILLVPSAFTVATGGHIACAANGMAAHTFVAKTHWHTSVFHHDKPVTVMIVIISCQHLMHNNVLALSFSVS